MIEVAAKDPRLDGHVWIILSDPNRHPQLVVIANYTTFKPGKDPTCILKQGSHPRITKDSCIAYRKAQVLSLANLEALYGAGMIRLSGHLDKALLDRILKGAATHDDMGPEAHKALVQLGLI